MADIVISIVAKVAEYLVGPVICEGKYFLCVNKVIKDLENERKELISERDNLLDRVERAKERTEVIEKPVEKWLDDVKSLLEELEALEKRMRANTRCFQGDFPTWRRYRLSKQMVKKKDAMERLKGKSNIHPISHLAPLPGIQYQSPENFTYFQSTKVAYNQIMESLRDDGIHMIGVYGMGGCGKTTLVAEAGKKAEESNMFDKVISITVSQTPNIKDIQGKMAGMLNLPLNEEDEVERAKRLWLCLKQKKRILVIVDNLWKEFDLMSIGIRIDNVNKGAWKILVTTRNRQVCTSMDCQKIIHLGLLSEHESWTLFQKHAKITDEFSKSLDGVPQELCNKCKGLPQAIVTVASSLKGKHEKSEWDVALYKLRNSAEFDDHDVGVRDALSCLELSYKYLQNKEEKLLFLMCSMFPEDCNISREDLILYAIGLGVGGRHPLMISRSLIEVAINKLLESCLLMPAEEMECVKMHDLVREVALWIAKRSPNQKILVNVDKPLNTLAGDDSIQNYFAVSSWWYNENPSIGPLQAANLEMLLLHINTGTSQSSFDLSNLTFEGIEGLKVFSLTNGSYSEVLFSLPSIQLLTNVRTLRLNGLKLGNISFIATLTKLEVLDLQHCFFNELPYEIGNLKRLKVLDLTGSYMFEKTYNGALGRCSQLEAFYFFTNFRGASADGLVREMVVDAVTLSKLQCFSIDNCWFPYFSRKRTRSLSLYNFNICKLRASTWNILQIAENVAFEYLHGGCKNIIPDMVEVVGGMDDLNSLKLCRCPEIECIFNTTSNAKIDDLIPKLVELDLYFMDKLTGLCQGPPLQVLRFFKKLEKLVIKSCIKIHITFPWECNLQNLKILILGSCKSGEVLFPTSVAQSLQKLEELEISNCLELKLIIAAIGRERDGCNTREDIVPDQMNSHFLMPSLRKVTIDNCPMLESIFPICYVEGLSGLKSIDILRVPELKFIFGEYDHEHYSSHQYQNHIMLPQLEVLKLNHLHNFIGICPKYCHAKWPSHSLKKIFVEDCPELAMSWIAVMIRSDHSQPSRNENLPLKLGLTDLPQLNSISWLGPTTRSLQCLQRLKVSFCESLKSLFSMEESRSLPELMSLTIHSCKELEHIVYGEVYFPKLTHVEVIRCNKLISLFPVAMVKMLPQLSTLQIINSDQFEEVFRHDGGNRTINEMEVILPNLTEITLYYLPRFVDICQGYKLQAVKLRQLIISECPKVSRSLKAMQVALGDDRF